MDLILTGIGTEKNDRIELRGDLASRAVGKGGDDLIIATQASHTTALHGDAGDDTISGSNYTDYFYGGSGDDNLWAVGGSSDVLYGGKGKDVFRVDHDDVIVDFNPCKDKIIYYDIDT